jgi:hypothetical protein
LQCLGALAQYLVKDCFRVALVCVGDVDQWSCGFYPGSEPGEYLSGTAATFDQARTDFGAAWPVFLAKRTDADFTAFRRHRAFMAWKYAM